MSWSSYGEFLIVAIVLTLIPGPDVAVAGPPAGVPGGRAAAREDERERADRFGEERTQIRGSHCSEGRSSAINS